MTAVAAHHVFAGDAELRDQLSNLQGLLMLSMLMTESGDEGKILHLAATSVPSFGCCHLVGLYLSDGGWRAPLAASPGASPEAVELSAIEEQLGALGRSGGAIAIPGAAWGWALPLWTLEGHRGYFIAAAPREPSQSEQFLLRALARTTQIHDRFTRVAVAGEGQEGIARAAHELTGYPVAVEDRYGNLRAWAGPNRPDPYPKDAPARREQMLRRA